MRKVAVLFSLFVALILLSACGTLHLEVNRDGSGSAEISIETNEWITKEAIEEQFKSMEENEGISKPKVKEKKGVVTASFKFDDLSALEDDAYQLPVGDLVIIEDSRLEDLVFVNSEKEFTEKSNEIFLRFPSNMNDFEETKITLPGKVVAHSENIELVNKKEVEVTSGGPIYIVYEQGSNIGGIFLTIFILAIVAGAVVAAVVIAKNRTAGKKPQIAGPTGKGDSDA